MSSVLTDGLLPGSELRHDPVQKRWVIVASERSRRPVEYSWPKADRSPDPNCPFCAGREDMTPPAIASYSIKGSSDHLWDVRVVGNKYPALGLDRQLSRKAMGHYDRRAGVGAHEVIVETPDHFPEMGDLSVDAIGLVLQAYRDRVLALRSDPRLRYVLVFKNSGYAAGASLAHSHSQVMATPVTPRTVAMELASAREHFQIKERCIFCDILQQELNEQQRIVLVDESFVTHCPYASRFPFEMAIHPRQHAADFADCSNDLLLVLARHLKEVLVRMKKALGGPSYNMVLHTAPNIHSKPWRRHYWDTLELDWHWHFEILPRISNVAGFEWGTGFYINPVPPEIAAGTFRYIDE